MRWLDPINRPSGNASPAPIRKPTTTRYRLPMVSMISSPENSHASQLPSTGSYALVGDRYSNHLCTTAQGDGNTSGLTHPMEDANCQMAITDTGTSNPCRTPPLFCFAIIGVLPYLRFRLFLACSNKSVFTQSLATGGLAILPVPYLTMVSVVIWICSGVMS